MTVDEVIAAASAKTGLKDIGDPACLEGLRRLLDAYASEARYTERGSAMAHEDLVNYMATRMQIEDWLASHPELLERPIEKPLFVFGLPRTGTTLTINLLASDPARRSFLRWEIYEPIPPALPGRGGDERVHGRQSQGQARQARIRPCRIRPLRRCCARAIQGLHRGLRHPELSRLVPA